MCTIAERIAISWASSSPLSVSVSAIPAFSVFTISLWAEPSRTHSTFSRILESARYMPESLRCLRDASIGLAIRGGQDKRGRCGDGVTGVVDGVAGVVGLVEVVGVVGVVGLVEV